MTRLVRFHGSIAAALAAIVLAYAPVHAAAAATPPAATPAPVTAARPSPDWVRDAVVYQIFPRNFSAKGNFDGIIARLDELRALGVDVLWLMPIHPVGKKKAKGTYGSPYAVRDYYGIDPALGSRQDFKRFVAEAHRRGLKVILDVVLNHSSWDCNLITKHPDFYTHKDGQIVPPDPGWSDVADFNYDNPKLREYMIGALAYWVKEFDVDGFRADVAWGIPVDFWESARAALDPLKPGLFLLAESDKPELLVKAFDADYAWGLHAALSRVFAGSAPASTLREVWEADAKRWPAGALRLRFTDNHDERRALARFGERATLAASAFAFALDGVPMLYNGMEVGDTQESGAPALFEKLPVFWPIAERRTWFQPFYRQLIALRKAHPALRRGETVWVKTSDDSRVVSFLRRGGGEEVLVAINASSMPFKGTLQLPAGWAGAKGCEELTLPPTVPAAPGHAKAEAEAIPPLKLPELVLPSWGVRMVVRR